MSGKNEHLTAVRFYHGCSHGFFDDTRADVYRAAEAKDAWERTLKLFAANLNG
ncbi:MAG: dienelactone hydrolase family protein [Candidatus Binatus sp.]|uniref:dienelactone hydrolase family protein n=1 Tax=Candidatus Binatus sp. TaxID=2811406 RepID=UPI003C800AB9